MIVARIYGKYYDIGGVDRPMKVGSGVAVHGHRVGEGKGYEYVEEPFEIILYPGGWHRCRYMGKRCPCRGIRTSWERVEVNLPEVRVERRGDGYYVGGRRLECLTPLEILVGE